jgi:hypothetical protein
MQWVGMEWSVGRWCGSFGRNQAKQLAHAAGRPTAWEREVLATNWCVPTHVDMRPTNGRSAVRSAALSKSWTTSCFFFCFCFVAPFGGGPLTALRCRKKNRRDNAMVIELLCGFSRFLFLRTSSGAQTPPNNFLDHLRGRNRPRTSDDDGVSRVGPKQSCAVADRKGRDKFHDRVPPPRYGKRRIHDSIRGVPGTTNKHELIIITEKTPPNQPTKSSINTPRKRESRRERERIVGIVHITKSNQTRKSCPRDAAQK